MKKKKWMDFKATKDIDIKFQHNLALRTLLLINPKKEDSKFKKPPLNYVLVLKRN